MELVGELGPVRWGIETDPIRGAVTETFSAVLLQNSAQHEENPGVVGAAPGLTRGGNGAAAFDGDRQW
jgi:hypothetical protein